MRDVNTYSEKYVVPSFEQYKVYYRRKMLLEIIDKYNPKHILEIGCGSEPLFLYVKDRHFTIVEPAQDFVKNALNQVENHGEEQRVTCIQGFFEEKTSDLLGKYDMIICASLLHEVEEPVKLIKAITSICNKDTVVHISVPNANSIHRLLGKEMGILNNVHDKSQNNVAFQQNSVFDSDSLIKLVETNGLKVIESGSFFLKPFSHNQMYALMNSGILNRDVLDGLYNLGKHLPEYGSEIYINGRAKTVE